MLVSKIKYDQNHCIHQKQKDTTSKYNIQIIMFYSTHSKHSRLINKQIPTSNLLCHFYMKIAEVKNVCKMHHFVVSLLLWIVLWYDRCQIPKSTANKMSGFIKLSYLKISIRLITIVYIHASKYFSMCIPIDLIFKYNSICFSYLWPQCEARKIFVGGPKQIFLGNTLMGWPR